jgi:NTE family protein
LFSVFLNIISFLLLYTTINRFREERVLRNVKRLSALLIILMGISIFVSGCSTMSMIMPEGEKKGSGKVALALGGGASRGFAHIGVLKILESNNIPVDMVVGTSAGSFVGSLYCYGFRPYQIQKMALEIERGDIIDVTIPDNGFIKGELLEDYVNRMIANTPLDKLSIPLFVISTDIQSGSEIVFGSGNTGKAVRASCAIPGIFNPVIIGGRMYVDGGVVIPVGVDTARKYGADIVIAVDISSDLDTSRPVGTVETILQSVNIMNAKMSADQLSRADVVIRPRVGHIGATDFSKRHEAILEGERAAISALPKIREVLSRKRAGLK